jgi:dienelactone hydrolase
MLKRFPSVMAIVLGVLAQLPIAAHGRDSKVSHVVDDNAGSAVTFESSDGVLLHGRLFTPAGRTEVRGAIVFVHEPFRSSRDWAYMADRLARKGFHSLIFDLRGHGESLMQGDEELDREIFMEADWADLRLDLRAAVAFLKERSHVPAEKLHLAGADLGGSLALQHAVKDEAMASVTMLSPGLGYDGLNVVGFGKAMERPLLLVFSTEDGYSRKSAQVIAEEAAGPVHVEMYYGVGHGSKMLSREPTLETLLISWFLGTVIIPENRPVEEAQKPEVSAKNFAGDLDNEAEKKRLEEQRKATEAETEEAGGEEEERKRWVPGG